MTALAESRRRSMPALVPEPQPGPVGRRFAGLSPIAAAVIEAVAYADVFDWALTPDEIRHDLPIEASVAEVGAALDDPEILPYLERHGSIVTMRGRATLAQRRGACLARARSAWPRAARYAGLVARLPFVRMVAITGSLAVGAVDRAADVDLLVVTEDRRLWLTRALAMAVVRLAAIEGVRLCPNYLLAESALDIDDRSVFTAHELVQMVPIAPSPAGDQLVRRNAWVHAYLPNARPRPPAAASPVASGLVRRVAEAMLRTGIGDAIERWERERKVRRLRAESRSAETRYDELVCKGHTEAHGGRVLEALDARLAALEQLGNADRLEAIA